MARNIVNFVWIILEVCEIASVYLRWCVALINLSRGITVFRLFDGTRFYIELIFRSFNDIKYFFLMFTYSTFAFGFLLMISREDELGFGAIWGESYDLNFGNYEDSSDGIYFMKYIVYFGATFINVVLMLNLLISILGDSYERFQLEQSIVDIKEKASISMELQSIMFWAQNYSMLKYIRLCNSAFRDGEDQDWEGRIRFMDKKLDRNMREIAQSNRFVEIKIAESSKLVESKATSAENKIASVETIISSIENKMENRMGVLENKIDSLENKIKQSVESNIQDLSLKIEIILKILSK